jgi:hypothetical protein
LLRLNERYILLQPNQKEHIMVNVTLGHKVECSIIYLDQNGNPMLTAPKPDSPPAWTNGNPAVDTLAIAADGSTCEISTVATGADTVNLTLVVGGASFSASLSLTIQAVPQVLTSIAIGATVS